MKKNNKENRGIVLAQTRERVEKLVGLAVKTVAKDPELAGEYARLAHRIAQKRRCGLPKNFSLAICRKCLAVRQFGKNTRAVPDTKTGSVVYVCSCGSKRRFYFKEKKMKGIANKTVIDRNDKNDRNLNSGKRNMKVLFFGRENSR